MASTTTTTTTTTKEEEISTSSLTNNNQKNENQDASEIIETTTMAVRVKAQEAAKALFTKVYENVQHIGVQERDDDNSDKVDSSVTLEEKKFSMRMSSKKRKVSVVDEEDEGAVEDGKEDEVFVARTDPRKSTVICRTSAKHVDHPVLKNKKSVTWLEMFKELKRYRTHHKHCLVPQHGSKLGKWVNHQRDAYRYKMANKNINYNNKITDHQISELDKIGFVWCVTEKKVAWEDKFEELKCYKIKFGDCLVPKKGVEGFESLGRWVRNQRTAYLHFNTDESASRSKSRGMTQEKINLLESIGFNWNPKKKTKKMIV